MFCRNSVFNANSVDPDQTPHSVASDLGLHFLTMSFSGTTGLNGLKDSLDISNLKVDTKSVVSKQKNV